jgi:hypothetical protein
MKKTILKLAAAVLLSAAILTVPTMSRGADQTSTNTPAAMPDNATPGKFKGAVTAVDTNAMTFTVGDQTFNVTSESRLSKNGKPATLSETVVGDPARGTYTTGSDGKLNVTKARFGKGGGKGGGNKKKKSKDSSETPVTPPVATAPSTTPPAAGGSQ